ncbi:tape measure protein [Arthrobacter phage Aoka]|nr:tape measure protein [Arthrobacter phage Aoka]
MAQATDAVWLPVLPSMKGFGPALVKGAGSEADKAGDSIGRRFGKGIMLGTAAIGAGATAVGAALYKVGEVFDDVTDTIRTGTGATGKNLDGLVDVAKRVGTQVPAEFAEIGTAVADINTRMGLTGPTLEKVASQYLEAGRVLGEAVDVGKTSAAFNAFEIKGDAVSGALDHLFQVSQATGIGMNELAEQAAKNAPALQTLGFSFEETTAMIGSFDKAGLNSSAVMASMSKGLVTLAKEGEEPAAAFKRVQGEIAAFVEKGDEAGALNLASKVFGTRGATQFIGAVKSGAINLGDMSKAAGQTGDTILGVGEDTADFAEQWQMFKNKVLVWLEPMASKVFGALGFAMGEVTAGVTAFGAAWEANDGDITSSGIPGLFEQVAYWGRQAFDYINGTAIPAAKDFGTLLADTFGPSIERVGTFLRDVLVPNVQNFGGELGGQAFTALQDVGSFLVTDLIPALGNLSTWLLDNWDQIVNVATGIGVLLLPAFVRLGVGALVSAGQQVLAWAMAQGGAVKTGVIYLAQSFMIIGRWIAMGAAAIASGAQTAAIWALYRIEAIKGALAHGAQAARVAAGWVVMSAAAVASGAKTAAVWTGTVIAQAASGAGSFLLQVGRVVGGWVLMGLQSMIQAARMAAAWLIAMGPVGWVIAAVIGLVAIVIANWDKIASFTRDLWEKHVKPVFDALGNFITKDVPAAFEKGVGFIKTAWEKLQDIAKVPVKFVVNTIINDGLINGMNTIGGFFNLPKIPRLELPAGFAGGGYTGDGGKYEPKGVVHGGEFVLTKAQTRKAGVRNLYALAQSLDGYAGGGFVKPLRELFVTNGYNRTHKGVDFAAGEGTPVFATESGRVSWSGPGVRAPGVWGGNEIHIDGNSGIQSWFAHLSRMAVRVGDMVRAGQQIGLSGNTGISSGPHLHFGTFRGGWPNDVNPLGYLGGAGMPSGGGFNPLAGILEPLLEQFKKNFPGGGFMADLAIGIGKQLFDGAVKFVTGQSGQDERSAGSAAGIPYLHDQGGVIHPGLSQIVNRTRKPEALLNPQQWADMHSLAARARDGGTGDTWNVQLPPEASVNDLMDAVTFKQRVNTRSGARR